MVMVTRSISKKRKSFHVSFKIFKNDNGQVNSIRFDGPHNGNCQNLCPKNTIKDTPASMPLMTNNIVDFERVVNFTSNQEHRSIPDTLVEREQFEEDIQTPYGTRFFLITTALCVILTTLLLVYVPHTDISQLTHTLYNKPNIIYTGYGDSKWNSTINDYVSSYETASKENKEMVNATMETGGFMAYKETGFSEREDMEFLVNFQNVSGMNDHCGKQDWVKNEIHRLDSNNRDEDYRNNAKSLPKAQLKCKCPNSNNSSQGSFKLQLICEFELENNSTVSLHIENITMKSLATYAK